MESGNFDTLPQLSKNDALRILKTSLENLSLSSDYYKAVFHLSKYPSPETELALLELVKSKSSKQAVLIGKRKAIEVLGKMQCKKAIPYIGESLNSSDPYIVENSALALADLGCKELKIHHLIGNLLDKPNQNKRALIKSLGKMRAFSELSKIKEIFSQKDLPLSIKCAAIVAISNITGKLENIELLSDLLDSLNQNQRICAVQDIIDAKAYKLIPRVLKTPISPFFRIQAVISLLPSNYNKLKKISIIDSLDSIVIDEPNNMNLDKNLTTESNYEFFIEELFNPDFNKSYFALSKLKEINSKILFSKLNLYWNKFKKDYGALYFLIILFRYLDIYEKQDTAKALEMIDYCLDKSWPDNMKFKPQAIFSSIYIDLNFFFENIVNWLDYKKNKYWFSRYTALFAIERLIENNRISLSQIKFLNDIDESNAFARLKLNFIINKYLLS